MSAPDERKLLNAYLAKTFSTSTPQAVGLTQQVVPLVGQASGDTRSEVAVVLEHVCRNVCQAMDENPDGNT